jgi:hypothetical protein
MNHPVLKQIGCSIILTASIAAGGMASAHDIDAKAQAAAEAGVQVPDTPAKIWRAIDVKTAGSVGRGNWVLETGYRRRRGNAPDSYSTDRLNSAKPTWCELLRGGRSICRGFYKVMAVGAILSEPVFDQIPCYRGTIQRISSIFAPTPLATIG